MDYLQVEKMVKYRFDNRPNAKDKIDFSTPIVNDVLKAIVKTYIMYKERFPEEIDGNEIEAAFRFSKTLKKDLPKDLAELYLDRLLLNMITVEVYGEETHYKGLAQSGSVSFNLSKMNEQIKKWDDGIVLTDKEKSELSKKLYEKVIVHELSHNSAIYLNQGVVGLSEECSRLEEIMAEKTALDVTNCRVYFNKEYYIDGETNKQVKFAIYNPESSNAFISSFIELAPYAFGEKRLTRGRLVNPTQFIGEINRENAEFAVKGKTFAQTLKSDCKAITDTGIVRAEKMIEWQYNFLKIGGRRITNKDYINTVSESEFCTDFDSILRTSNLLVRYYNDGKLQNTKNLEAYNKTLINFEKIFAELKSKRGMFVGVKDFEELKSQRISEIRVARNNALKSNQPEQKNNAVNKIDEKFVDDLISKFRLSESELSYSKRGEYEFDDAKKVVDAANKKMFERKITNSKTLIRILLTAQTISLEGQRNFYKEILAIPEINDEIIKIKNNKRIINEMDSIIEEKKLKGERLGHRETKLEELKRVANSSIKNHQEEFALIKKAVDNNEMITFTNDRTGYRQHLVALMYALNQGKYDEYNQGQNQKQ